MIYHPDFKTSIVKPKQGENERIGAKTMRNAKTIIETLGARILDLQGQVKTALTMTDDLMKDNNRLREENERLEREAENCSSCNNSGDDQFHELRKLLEAKEAQLSQMKREREMDRNIFWKDIKESNFLRAGYIIDYLRTDGIELFPESRENETDVVLAIENFLKGWEGWKFVTPESFRNMIVVLNTIRNDDLREGNGIENKIAQIKRIRAEGKIGLKEAKDICEWFSDRKDLHTQVKEEPSETQPDKDVLPVAQD